MAKKIAKTFVPESTKKQNTSEIEGNAFNGQTQYHQMSPYCNEFTVLEPIKGHRQLGNINPVDNMKRFIG